MDTSVWIDHLRKGDQTLATLLERCEALMHPMVLGELACGGLRNRTEVPPARLWTRDRQLNSFAESLGVGYS